MAAEREHDREHQVVVFGATGYVGRLTAEHLARHAPPGTRLALAGRSRERLERTRAELARDVPAVADWPLVVADSTDPAAVRALAESATAVATTVGPYAKYGLPLVAACAAAGTHYADLTGEVLFARESVQRHHAEAERTGARVVHSAGFDSVPSDLGALLARDAAAAAGDGDLARTTLALVGARGGFSGGTVDSLRTQLDEVKADKAKRAAVLDPYALSPDRDAEPDRTAGAGKQPDVVAPSFDGDVGRWVGPFVMAPYNTRVVRRSAALLGYGPAFRYREVFATGSNPVLGPVLAGAVAVGTAGLAAGLALPGTRQLLDRVLPEPGEGPSAATRAKGYFTTETHARTTTGAHHVVTVAAQGDPGYAATAVMLGEAVLALALDGDRLPDRAGVLTPASGIGTLLADRLRDRGFRIETARR